MTDDRMLEAAMLGIPYEGRIPDFSAQPARPDQPMSPTAVAGRAVRQEQDYAYEQSLQVSSHNNVLEMATGSRMSWTLSVWKICAPDWMCCFSFDCFDALRILHRLASSNSNSKTGKHLAVLQHDSCLAAFRRHCKHLRVNRVTVESCFATEVRKCSVRG